MIYKALEVIQIFGAGRTGGRTDKGVLRGPRGPKKGLEYGDHVDNHNDLDDDGGHDDHDAGDKNLLDRHQRLPDVFGSPMEGNLVQGFLYQAEKCKIFLPNKILVATLILKDKVIGAIVT